MTSLRRAMGSALVLAVGSHAWAADERPQPSLADVVLLGSFGVSSLSPRAYRGAPCPCLEKYAAAAAPHLSMEPAFDGEDCLVALRRWRLERHLRVIHGAPAREDAARFAAAVPLSLEWEGMSDGPVQEAESAEQWLSLRPRSPIAPFLHLFAAHRWRAAFETAGQEKAGDLATRAAARYRQHLQAARSAGNDWIACIAGDMEALPYVYLPGSGRP